MNENYNIGDEVVVFLTEDDNDGHKAVITDKVVHAEDNVDYEVELLNEYATLGAILGGVAIQGALTYASHRQNKKVDQARYQKEYRRRNKGKIKAYNKKRAMMNSSVEMNFPALLEAEMKNLKEKDALKMVNDVIKLLNDSKKRSIPVMTNTPAILNKLNSAREYFFPLNQMRDHIDAALEVLKTYEKTGKPTNIQDDMLKHLMLVKPAKSPTPINA